MTQEEIFETIRRIRSYGYAVTVFTPEELGEVAPRAVEEAMVEAGANAIEYLE